MIRSNNEVEVQELTLPTGRIRTTCPRIECQTSTPPLLAALPTVKYTNQSCDPGTSVPFKICSDRCPLPEPAHPSTALAMFGVTLIRIRVRFLHCRTWRTTLNSACGHALQNTSWVKICPDTLCICQGKPSGYISIHSMLNTLQILNKDVNLK